MTKFSVITPLYNDGWKTLDKFLLHLNEQDYKNFEVILVYNSPTDINKKVAKVLKGFKKLDIKEIDAGYDPKLGRGNHCRAFNVGAKQSTGDVLLFLDPDIYMYPGIFREYKEAFESKNVEFVYGDYDFEGSQGRLSGRKYSEYELRCANYISGAFPIKKSAFKGWDENLESLQDWDMRLSAVDAGAKGYYLARPCFTTDVPSPDGISAYSSKNWLKLWSSIRDKHGFPVSKIAVTSIGAPLHATKMAELLHADSRVQSNIVSFKEHNYETIYLLGFYSLVWQNHMSLFYKDGIMKGGELSTKKRVIHWIGTDVMQLRHKLSWVALQNIVMMLNDKDFNFVHLCECDFIQKELLEIGIKAEIVPLPPSKLFYPVALPKEFTIGVYTNPTQDLYYEQFMYDIANSMPDIKFKFFGTESMKGKKEENIEWCGWVDMETFLQDISAIVRLTRHDGLPISVIEAISMGRNALTSVPVKYSLLNKYVEGEPSKDEVIRQIRELQEMPVNMEGSEYWNNELSHEVYRERMSKYL